MALRDYAPLPFRHLQAEAGYAQPSQTVTEGVMLDDPALQVMTDFRATTAIIVLSGDALDEAHRRMIQRAVRLLLVVDQDRRVVGVITATDVLGEKPTREIAQRGIHRDELLVRDVMTPQALLEVLDLASVRAAKVGHVVATLQSTGRQHALVVEGCVRTPDGARRFLRDAGGAAAGRRQSTSEIARTFAEIEPQLAR